MSSDHYFSEAPDSKFKPKEIQVAIDGRAVTVTTAGGIFSPDHIDQGTLVLLDHLDEVPPSGNLLDVGCGWGPIALSLASRAPQATVWAIDVNQRSLDLTAANAARLGLTNVKVSRPEDLPAELRFRYSAEDPRPPERNTSGKPSPEQSKVATPPPTMYSQSPR